MSDFDLKKYLKEKKDRVDQAMSRWVLPESTDPETLHKSVRYSLFADGKRIRPVLVLATAGVLEIAEDDIMPVAAALEMIHVFSLIHDDLPAMDDDDLRRGQPTNHKVFGEAVAILAGDALLAQAFVPLSDLSLKSFRAENILRVIRLIAEASGAPGMIGGQVIDLESENRDITLERLKTLHRMKTGALIRAAVVAPAILNGADEKTVSSLNAYGEAVGLAFQIADDILDIEGGSEIGKDIGSDLEKNKSTYPKFLGLDGAKKERERMLNVSLDALSGFNVKAEPLRAIARYIVARNK